MKTFLLRVTMTACAWGLASGIAHAQSDRTNASVAQVLFDEGRALVDAGNYAVACPKFVESHRLDPSGGTILHAAACHEKEGKLATAWSEFNEGRSLALRDRRGDREKVANERIASLAPRLGKLKVIVPPDIRQIEGLHVTLDGKELPSAAWETKVPVDKGSHVLTASATGRVTVTKSTDVTDGATSEVTVPPLPDAPVPTPTPTKIVEAPARPAVVAPVESHRGDTQRTIGLVVGGVGVAGVVVGTVFGIRAIGIGDQYAEPACTTTNGQRSNVPPRASKIRRARARAARCRRSDSWRAARCWRRVPSSTSPRRRAP